MAGGLGRGGVARGDFLGRQVADGLRPGHGLGNRVEREDIRAEDLIRPERRGWRVLDAIPAQHPQLRIRPPQQHRRRVLNPAVIGERSRPLQHLVDHIVSDMCPHDLPRVRGSDVGADAGLGKGDE